MLSATFTFDFFIERIILCLRVENIPNCYRKEQSEDEFVSAARESAKKLQSILVT